MLRMTYRCSSCGAEGSVEDLTNVIGCCPKCGRHRGDVEYYTDMKVEEFLDELYNMSPNDFSKYADAIRECAYTLKCNL